MQEFVITNTTYSHCLPSTLYESYGSLPLLKQMIGEKPLAWVEDTKIKELEASSSINFQPNLQT